MEREGTGADVAGKVVETPVDRSEVVECGCVGEVGGPAELGTIPDRSTYESYAPPEYDEDTTHFLPGGCFRRC